MGNKSGAFTSRVVSHPYLIRMGFAVIERCCSEGTASNSHATIKMYKLALANYGFARVNLYLHALSLAIDLNVGNGSIAAIGGNGWKC